LALGDYSSFQIQMQQAMMGSFTTQAGLYGGTSNNLFLGVATIPEPELNKNLLLLEDV